MVVVGIDLSGPSNCADTAVACFVGDAKEITCTTTGIGLDDLSIYQLIKRLSGEKRVVVGLDAPLSYNPGGGHRPADSDLSKRLIKAGLRPGSVMAPTMNRMAYLTLRGISVARMIDSIGPQQPKVLEVHPAGALVLHGAAVRDVLEMKRDLGARTRLVHWLSGQGLHDSSKAMNPSDHLVAAYGCAFAAWKWVLHLSVWYKKADPPMHPYDFAC